MIHNIADRDEDGHRMKVTWEKMDNFLVTFSGVFFRVEQDFKDGKYGSDWSFRKWLVTKVGVSLDTVMVLLNAREQALAGDERAARARVEAEERKRKRAEKEQNDAQRAAEAAERKRKADVKKAAVAAAKAARDKAREDKKKQSQKNKRNATRRHNYHAKQSVAVTKANEEAARATAQLEVQAAVQRVQAVNPRAAQLLNECDQLDVANRIELGRRYSELQQLVNDAQVGNNPKTGKPWAWNAWCKDEAKIKKSRTDIYNCIVEFVQSVNKSQGDSVDDNVVPMRAAINVKK